MTETEFRIKYSEMMECYQSIEFNLKRICAALNKNKPEEWFEQFSSYDRDAMGNLITALAECNDKQGKQLISERKLLNLSKLKERRNYWAHQCFYPEKGIKLVIDPKTGNKIVEKNEDVKTIKRDHGDSKKMAEDIDKLFTSLPKYEDLQIYALDQLLETFDKEHALSISSITEFDPLTGKRIERKIK